jgi:predicted DNA-binding protein YlxM (UPF0122 family)
MPASKYYIFENNKDEILYKYFKKGYSAKEIAEEYNFNRLSFKDYLEKNNLSTKGRTKLSARQKNKYEISMLEKYGVKNPSQLDNKNKGKKISKLKRKNKDWIGEKNPNFGNRIGKNNGFKSGKRKDLNNIFFRSSWEANIARIFKYLDIEFIYEPNRFRINNNETYTPDFYIPKFKKFIEVKGYWRDDAYRKYNEFLEKYNINMILIDENFYTRIIDKFKNKVLLEN